MLDLIVKFYTGRYRRVIVSCFLSLVEAFFLVYGNTLSSSYYSTIDSSFIIKTLLLFVVFQIINTFIFSIEFYQDNNNCIMNCYDSFNTKKFLIMWFSIFMMWIPVFLAYYPTLWAYDVYDQIPKIRGRTYNLKHPLLHTLLIQSILLLGKRLGSYEIGMVMMSIIQMLVMSFIFSYSIEIVTNWFKNNFYLKVILILFIGLMPYHSILSISMTKDVLFSGFCLLFFVLMIDEIVSHKQHTTSIIITMILLLSFRNNAIYAFIPFCVVLLFYNFRNLKRWIIMIIIGFILFFGGQSYLINKYNVEPGPIEEKYCIPMQCLTGLAIKHDKYLPKYGTNEKLFGIISRDMLPEDLASIYYPYIADPVKQAWINTGDLKGKELLLIKTWVKMFFCHPHDCIDIWAKLHLGSWYVFDTTHAEIYSIYDHLPERQGYLLTDFKIINEMDFVRPDSKLPQLEKILELIATDNVHQKWPILSLVFAPATYFWIMLYVICLFIANNNKKYYPLLFFMLLYITIILGPTSLVRYMYPLMCVVPFSILYLFVFKKDKL